MAAKFGLDEPKPVEETPAPEAREATEGEGEPEIELDIPADDQPQAEEWLEIERKGEKRKLSKEEAAKYASMGFDYATNTEALKAEKAIITQYKQALEAKGQITPAVIEARANVVAYERALAPYQSVDWAALAQNDPIGYTQHRAQFDSYRDGYQQARYQYDQTTQQAQKVDQVIDEAQIAQERQKLYELNPELRDENRWQSEKGRIVKYLEKVGADEATMRFVSSSAVALNVLLKAIKYEAALEARSTQVKSPALKPGAAPVRLTAQAQKHEAIKAVHQAKTPESKKAALDNALAIKFGLK